jgi:hypothetical protein
LIDIIRAHGQFGGFSGYPGHYDASQNLQDLLNLAGNDNDRRQPRFREFVQNAIDVASAQNAVADPSPTRLYAWRTEGSGSPGPRFAEFQTLSRNTFYTLTP